MAYAFNDDKSKAVIQFEGATPDEEFTVPANDMIVVEFVPTDASKLKQILGVNRIELYVKKGANQRTIHHPLVVQGFNATQVHLRGYIEVRVYNPTSSDIVVDTLSNVWFSYIE